MNKTFYQKIYSKQADFYRRHKVALTALKTANTLCTLLVVAGYIALCLITLLPSAQPTKYDYLRVLGAPALCFVTASAARIFFDRKRPYERTEEEGGVIPLLHKKTKGHSFPSRHAASAFVIGTVAIAYMPPLGIGLLVVGLIIDYTRFSTGVHFPTDLLAGSLWGAALGLLAFL